MGRFIGNITVTRLENALWVLDGDFSYENHKLKVTAKSGMQTDFASIPKLFWNVIGSPAGGKYIGASIIHDALYASHKLSKKDTDKLFLEMMKAEKVSYWRRYLMYYAVKWFGYKAYNDREVNKEVCEVVRYEDNID